ncbi:hypothetical protein G9A89_013943 [Geosiphon pyriformis]|nr:hypothetical protein G9A89_013943 [Geosiphon pyriformis]
MAVKKNPIANLSSTIPQIFQECQKSTTNHRKNVATLRKLQEQCSAVRLEKVFEGSSRSAAGRTSSSFQSTENGEQAFNREFVRNLNKVLAIKKKDPSADRVIKFVGAFIQFIVEKGIKARDEFIFQESDDEAISSRFVTFIIGHILRGIDAKDKHLRLRVCQSLALLSPSSLNFLSDALFERLKAKLIDRVRDKETSVRAQAIIALSKLQGEDIENDREVTDKLCEILQNDPSAEVRRAALSYVAHNEKTIPFLLERARDIDPITRRSVYTKTMEVIADFRILKIEDRENLLNCGLTDRDPVVKQACTKMLSTNWIYHANNDVLEFLERLDVVSSNIAKEALLACFASRPDLIETLQFDDNFWDTLTVERAFLARVYSEFCKEDTGKFDEAMPEVTRLAFYIQKYNNCIHEASEEDQINYEFVLGQLLILAGFLDYSDEVGRRTMFTLLRKMLMLPQIADEHIELIIEVMNRTTINERDFTRSIIEIISDLRESLDSDDTSFRHPHQPEELTVNMSHLSINPESIKDFGRSPAVGTSRARASSIDSLEEEEEDYKDDDDPVWIDLKCLRIVRSMLEKNEQNLLENPSMYGLLNDLIAPSVQSREPIIREMGVHCLGLCCLLDQVLARENLVLFIHCAKHGHDTLKAKSLMVIFDILMTFGYNDFISITGQLEQIRNLFDSSLNSENAEVQSIVVEGLAKLMLSKVFCDKEVLQKLVVRYFESDTVENLRLRQCLSYFLPVYCHSSAESQRVMGEIFASSLTELIRVHMSHGKGTDMISPLQIAQQLVDWTDPNQIVKSESNSEEIDYGLHGDIAVEILKALFLEQNREVRKLLCQILNKLNIDENVGILRLKKLTLLTGNLKSRRPLKDTLSKNAINKFENSLLKYFDEGPQTLDDNEIDQLEEIQAFVEDVEDDDDYSTIDIPIRTTRSRTSKAAALANLQKEIDDMLDDEYEE